MQTNLLIAIKNIVTKPILDIASYYKAHNRINNVGESLEMYIKDIFCNSLDLDMGEKLIKYKNNFSYLGNQNNPPDIMIKSGDAIEVKKIENFKLAIALNSSYPKDKIYNTSPMITASCKMCEQWNEKDLIYIIGVVKKEILKSLWFVYGDCYSANREIYERIKNKITSGLSEINDIELSETNEIGRVNKIDPLGITYLRIRGMWGIDNPVRVFDYITTLNQKNTFTLSVLILKNKYLSFPKVDRDNLEKLSNNDFKITDVKIKSPNNPAILLNAKFISFVIK